MLQQVYGKLKKRLDHVIDYIMNVEKTLNSDYGKEVYSEFHNLEEMQLTKK